jgi:peptide/nickel transport system substrate-binding protein
MSYRGVTRAVGLAVAATVVVSAPALAQKSKNWLRAATPQPVSVVDRVYNAQPATTLISKAIFDPIIMYDPVKRDYKPLLASSWRQIDDTTWEFKLRQDVKFHDGSKFDADDVVFYTKHVIDPKNNFRFKGSRFGWIKGVEKVDDYTVRITSKGPFAPALARMSGDMLGYPSDSFGKDPQGFGKHPIGTGPYKAAEVDPGTGVRQGRAHPHHLGARPADPSGADDGRRAGHHVSRAVGPGERALGQPQFQGLRQADDELRLRPV